MLKKIPDKMEYWQYSTVNPPTLGEGRGAGGGGLCTRPVPCTQ